MLVTSKSGFSLVELMIVLAILVSIAAIALPNLQRSFQRNELQDAGRLLQETLGELRQESLQTGRPLFVQFGWDSASIRVFRDAIWQAEVRQAEVRQAEVRQVEQRGATASVGGLGATALLPSDRSLDANLNNDDGLDASRRQAWELSEIRLTTDAWFSPVRLVREGAPSTSNARGEMAATSGGGDAAGGGQAMLDSRTAASQPSAAGADLGSQPSGWSKPLAILPNGSVDDFYFWVQLDRSLQCPVLWRGATGQLEIGPVQRVMESTAATDSRVSN